MNTNTKLRAFVIKWSTTNSKLIPAGAIRTESKSKQNYAARAMQNFGETQTELEERENPGFESPETKMGRIGLHAVEKLLNRFLRIEYRIVDKPGKVRKYAIMFFFVYDDKDLHEVVRMSQDHQTALNWLALQTFEGCRLWNNGDRMVVDMVMRKPNERAEHYLHFGSINPEFETFSSICDFCWAPIGKEKHTLPAPVQPDYLTQEFVDAEKRREMESLEEGHRFLRELFERAERRKRTVSA